VTGIASSVGKTTVTLGLMAALRRRGLTVQGFKIGPDFIDPAFHALVTGRPSYSLDSFMCGKEGARETFARAGADADIAVIEGMMGCFDGVGSDEPGSTAEIAKWLDAHVVFVVDARASSRSAAAVVVGAERFDPELKMAGAIANNLASEAHAAWVLEAIAKHCTSPALGALRKDPAFTMPERHLGLVTASEGVLPRARQDALAAAIESAVDLDRLLSVVGATRRDHGAPRAAARHEPRARIGIARDVGFQFYYPETFDRLREAGAELVFWSPETDAMPPVDALYFGGGYPELRAKALSANVTVRRAVKRFVDDGGPVYAECGGLMYLAEGLEDLDGRTHEMVGVLPATVRMSPRRLCLGYATVTTTASSLLGASETVARGHEFHYSTLDPVPDAIARVYRVADTRGAVRAEGYQIGNALISYVHVHFGSNPALASAFVDAAARYRAR